MAAAEVLAVQETFLVLSHGLATAYVQIEMRPLSISLAGHPSTLPGLAFTVAEPQC